MDHNSIVTFVITYHWVIETNDYFKSFRIPLSMSAREMIINKAKLLDICLEPSMFNLYYSLSLELKKIVNE